MDVLMISKAMTVGAYQKKLEEMAKIDDINLTVVVPPRWGNMALEQVHTCGYRLIVADIVFNGNFHLHFYPDLKSIMAEKRYDLIHIDEEPYNLATYQAMQLAQLQEARTVVFTWQNLRRFYPPPFSWMENYVLRHTDMLLVGNTEAQDVWRAKGYNGMIRLLPQHGFDPEIFYRRPIAKRASKPSVILQRSARRPSQPAMTIGFVGRLVREKGVDILLQAVAKLNGPWNLRILAMGSSPDRKRLERMAQWLGIGSRVTFDEQIPSVHVPNYLSSLDVLVLPSITRPNWKEQFGRVLMEAMACEVVTIGARSGAIPEVIGDAGLLFDEGNVDELKDQLQHLLDDVELRESLRQAGRQRFLSHYTHAAIAQRTVDIYRLIV